MKTTIVFIRHGQVENPRAVIYGRLPRFGLSALGRRQAAAAAEALSLSARSASGSRPIELDAPRAIFSSPMLRARQTAQNIAAQFPELKVHISRVINEVYSPYEGGPVAMVERSHWEVYEGIPANYEQPMDVLSRALKFIAEARRKYPGECVLAVSHGDLIYFLTLWATGQALTGKKDQTRYPAHASLSSFIFEGDGLEKPAYHYYRPEIKA
jgi:broad specificity phosphatase PhoE